MSAARLVRGSRYHPVEILIATLSRLALTLLESRDVLALLNRMMMRRPTGALERFCFPPARDVDDQSHRRALVPVLARSTGRPSFRRATAFAEPLRLLSCEIFSGSNHCRDPPRRIRVAGPGPCLVSEGARAFQDVRQRFLHHERCCAASPAATRHRGQVVRADRTDTACRGPRTIHSKCAMYLRDFQRIAARAHRHIPPTPARFRAAA